MKDVLFKERTLCTLGIAEQKVHSTFGYYLTVVDMRVFKSKQHYILLDENESLWHSVR